MDGLHSALHKGKVEVKFTKVSDGSERIMECTLYEHMIPRAAEGQESKRAPAEGITCVWDLDKAAWRSFRNDSVISWRIV